jgi:hypothetical protein
MVRYYGSRRTIKLLEHALNCARAAAAAHGDIKLVVVFGHCMFVCLYRVEARYVCLGRSRMECL